MKLYPCVFRLQIWNSAALPKLIGAFSCFCQQLDDGYLGYLVHSLGGTYLLLLRFAILWIYFDIFICSPSFSLSFSLFEHLIANWWLGLYLFSYVA